MIQLLRLFVCHLTSGINNRFPFTMNFIKLHGRRARNLSETCAISHFNYVANVQFRDAKRITLQFQPLDDQTMCNRSQGESLRTKFLRKQCQTRDFRP